MRRSGDSLITVPILASSTAGADEYIRHTAEAKQGGRAGGTWRKPGEPRKHGYLDRCNDGHGLPTPAFCSGLGTSRRLMSPAR